MTSHAHLCFRLAGLGVGMRDRRQPCGGEPTAQQGRPRARPRIPCCPHRRHQGSANTSTVLPRLKSICVLPPAATAMYCLPCTMYDTAGALTPAPHWNSQSFLPVAESNARNRPLPSPLNTRPPAVASTPPMSGCSVLKSHAILPVSTFTADSLPDCCSDAITLNAPPRHSLLPPG